MDLFHKQPDELIRLSVQAQTIITPRQKLAARDRLLRSAASQPMLVPLAIPPAPSRPAAHWLERLGSGILRGLHTLLFEEHRYQRAADNRHFMPITSIIGSTMVIHFYPPVRYQMH